MMTTLLLKRLPLGLLIGGSLLALTACESAKEDLGLARRSPDEFAVVERAPLEMPPDYYLRPPVPGAARPQESSPTQSAEEAVLGKRAKTGKLSKAEYELLQKTNATKANPEIRAIIDAETAQIAEDDKPTVKKILDLGGAKTDTPATVVDAPAEAARIKKAKTSGNAVTGATTPTIKQ